MPSPTSVAYQHGDRVRDTRNGSTGTIHIEPLSAADAADCGYSTVEEVRWDGLCVHEQLDLVRPYLTRI